MENKFGIGKYAEAISRMERNDRLMQLSDTVEKMNSDNYIERFIAEYQQTWIRYMKLKHFCNKIESAKIQGHDEPAHDCPLELLRDQQRVMGEYLHILEVRAVIEGVTPQKLGFGGLLG